jgi:hypothetical protein
MVWVVAAGAARGQVPPEAAPPAVQAVRVTAPPTIDGRLDDPAWRDARPFDAFVQAFPDEGAAPTERTEVRVLHDDRYLYVGVLAQDSRPSEVLRLLGRRDSIPFSDTVSVVLDPSRDLRSAFVFTLNAAGVQEDGVYYEDDSYTVTWDGVWDGAVAERPDGWSAELRIPLSLFRFPALPDQQWGFGVRREIGRSHELIWSVPMPRSAKGVVSRLGVLTGLSGLRPVADLEVVPYAAGRLVWQSQYRSDYLDGTRPPWEPSPRILDPMLDVGVDLRWAATPTLTLNATLNPDFGQVEADQIVQNLTTYELQFPEKRPFFNEGLDLFQPVGASEATPVPQQMFYSRRVGLQTPIFGAAKLTGRISDTLQVGLLDAVVSGGAQPAGSTESAPNRSLGWYPQQPLHLATVDSYPLQAPAPENFFAGVLKWQPAPIVTLGTTLTLAAPLTAPCTAEDLLQPPGQIPGRCTVVGGGAAAVDWRLRSRDSEWVFYGQAAASQVMGGPPERVLYDGTLLRPGDSGAGFYAWVKRQGGEPWRFDLGYQYAAPRLELNPSGFQQTQNLHGPSLVLGFVRPGGGGPFHSYSVKLRGESFFTTDGRNLNRGNAIGVWGEVLLRSFVGIGCDATYRDPHYDVREIYYTGVPYERSPYLVASCWASTDQSKALAGSLSLFGQRFFAEGSLASTWSLGGQAALVIRPSAPLETRLSVQLERNTDPARYLPLLSTPGTFVFGQLLAPYLSVVLRQLWVIAPRLTLQLYAQLFSTYVQYGPFYQASAPGDRSPILTSSLQPVTRPPLAVAGQSLGSHSSQLIVNLVLRWEYRIGSTLYLVYSRTQAELPWPGPEDPPATLSPVALGPGRAVDTLMVKWTYWWNP